MKCSNNLFPRVRVVLPKDDRDVTDQSFAKMSNINNIVDRYRRTKMLPAGNSVPLFLDHTKIPDAIAAYSAIREAREKFLELPEDLRNRIGNDPEALIPFLMEKENHEYLKKIGVFQAKKEPEKESIFSPKDLEFLGNLVKKQEEKPN